jgi:hypothetical protein
VTETVVIAGHVVEVGSEAARLLALADTLYRPNPSWRQYEVATLTRAVSAPGYLHPATKTKPTPKP